VLAAQLSRLYIETLQRQAAPPTVKQHMAAIRMLFSWLTEKGVLAMNPAREVKTERFSRTEGKTPAFVEWLGGTGVGKSGLATSFHLLHLNRGLPGSAVYDLNTVRHQFFRPSATGRIAFSAKLLTQLQNGIFEKTG
jgi:hypothetical protein